MRPWARLHYVIETDEMGTKASVLELLDVSGCCTARAQHCFKSVTSVEKMSNRTQPALVAVTLVDVSCCVVQDEAAQVLQEAV